MNSPIHLSSTPGRNSTVPHDEFLSAMILCENDSFAIPALRTIQNLNASFRGETDIRTSVWRFDALSQPEITPAALRNANDSALILISTKGDAPLPDAVQNLLLRALSRRISRPTALVLYAELPRDVGERAEPPACVYLRRLAKSAAADFFICPIRNEPPGRPQPSLQPASSHPRRPSPPPIGHSHWGINE